MASTKHPENSNTSLVVFIEIGTTNSSEMRVDILDEGRNPEAKQWVDQNRLKNLWNCGRKYDFMA